MAALVTHTAGQTIHCLSLPLSSHTTTLQGYVHALDFTKGPGQLHLQCGRLKPPSTYDCLHVPHSILQGGGEPASGNSSQKASPASLGSSNCLSDCLLPPLSSGRISSSSFPEILSLYPQELFLLRNKPFPICRVS